MKVNRTATCSKWHILLAQKNIRLESYWTAELYMYLPCTLHVLYKYFCAVHLFTLCTLCKPEMRFLSTIGRRYDSRALNSSALFRSRLYFVCCVLFLVFVYSFSASVHDESWSLFTHLAVRWWTWWCESLKCNEGAWWVWRSCSVVQHHMTCRYVNAPTCLVVGVSWCIAVLCSCVAVKSQVSRVMWVPDGCGVHVVFM